MISDSSTKFVLIKNDGEIFGDRICFGAYIEKKN